MISQATIRKHRAGRAGLALVPAALALLLAAPCLQAHADLDSPPLSDAQQSSDQPQSSDPNNPNAKFDPAKFPHDPELADPTPAQLKGESKQQIEEEKEGRDAARDIAKHEKLEHGTPLALKVQAIGARIGAIADTQRVTAGFGTSDVLPFHYTYHVIDSKDINAFSLPGGFIYIYTGLLSRLTSDDEIAGVLGHETAHAAHHHVPALEHQANKMGRDMIAGLVAALVLHVPPADMANGAAAAQYVGQAQLNNKFSETAEEDADHTGMIFMQKAGYNPVGMYSLLQQLKKVDDASPDVQEGFLQDHPLTSQRLAAARSELVMLEVPVNAHNLRESSGTMLANVIDDGSVGSATAADMRLGSNPIFRVSAADKTAAEQAANRLNDLLDHNLQLYEVKADGPNLVARGETLIAFSDADAAAQAQPGTSPDALAASAAKTIRDLIWSQTVTTPTDKTIEVGQSNDTDPYAND